MAHQFDLHPVWHWHGLNHWSGYVVMGWGGIMFIMGILLYGQNIANNTFGLMDRIITVCCIGMIGVGMITLGFEYDMIKLETETLCDSPTSPNCLWCALAVAKSTRREIWYLYDIRTHAIISDILIGSWNSINHQHYKVMRKYFTNVDTGQIDYTYIGELHSHPTRLFSLGFSDRDIRSSKPYSEMMLCSPHKKYMVIRNRNGTQRKKYMLNAWMAHS